MDQQPMSPTPVTVTEVEGVLRAAGFSDRDIAAAEDDTDTASTHGAHGAWSLEAAAAWEWANMSPADRMKYRILRLEERNQQLERQLEGCVKVIRFVANAGAVAIFVAFFVVCYLAWRMI